MIGEIVCIKRRVGSINLRIVGSMTALASLVAATPAGRFARRWFW